MKYCLFVCIFCLNSILFLYNLIISRTADAASARSAPTGSDIPSSLHATNSGNYLEVMRKTVFDKMTHEMTDRRGEMIDSYSSLELNDKRMEVPLVAKDVSSFSQNLNNFCGRFLNGRSFKSRSTDRDPNNNSIWRACSFKPVEDLLQYAAISPRINVSLHLRAKWLNYMDNLAIYVCYRGGSGVKTGRELSLMDPSLGQSVYPTHIENNWSIFDVSALLPEDSSPDVTSMVFAFVYRITDARQLSTTLLPRLYIAYYEDTAKKLKSIVFTEPCSDSLKTNLHIASSNGSTSPHRPPAISRACCLKKVELDFNNERWSHFIHFPNKINLTVCHTYETIYSALDHPEDSETGVGRVPAHLLHECCEAHQYKPFTVMTKSKIKPKNYNSFTFHHVDAKACVLRC